MDEAKTRDMVLSPVAYAGWTEDLKLVLRLLPVVVVPVMQNLLLRGTPKWEVAILTVGLWTALAAAVPALARGRPAGSAHVHKHHAAQRRGSGGAGDCCQGRGAAKKFMAQLRGAYSDSVRGGASAGAALRRQ